MTGSVKKSPLIDIDMLTMALQAGDMETVWWLDTYSGEVTPAPEVGDDVMGQSLLKEKKRSPGRYIDIKPVADTVHYELMESYIATLGQAGICESLYKALQCKRPSWHFKHALSKDPECEDNWYAFKEQFYALQARQWLRDRGLKYKEAKTYAATTDKKTLDLEAADSLSACMELVLVIRAQQRRYMIWQQDQQILLTVFAGRERGDEQLLAEMQINDHQLSGINHIIETYKVDVDVRGTDKNMNACLRFMNRVSRGEIQGCYHEGGVFHQLAAMLDMLLGIPAIQA